ncbi:MAG: DUF1499 domain-containing protein [Gemmatimonadota bacterium]
MSGLLRRAGRALSRNHAETTVRDVDARLRGRTYAVPFEQVWQAALALTSGGLRGWRLVQSDDYKGVIQAEAHTFFLRFVDDVLITVKLDENAQTRVDMQSRSRRGGADFGTNARRIGRFFHVLDHKLKR